jgi:hypothetical protein
VMIHFRTDEQPLNSQRTFACGIGPDLPEGDQWLGLYEAGSDRRVDCPLCNPHPRQLGTPISQLSGRSGEPGFAEFCRIARNWGFD